MLDLLGEVPEDQRGGLDVRAAEEFVALRIHPAGRGERGRLEPGGVGDAEAVAEATLEEPVRPGEPPLDPSQRRVLLDEDVVEPAMLARVLTLLAEVLVHLGAQCGVVDVGRRSAHGPHHVGLAVGHTDRQRVHRSGELGLERLPGRPGVVRPLERDRTMEDRALGHTVSVGTAGFDWRLQRPRQDSNLRTRLRRPMLYPLSYEGSPRGAKPQGSGGRA